MTMLALDWNATRVRAASAAPGGYPLVLPLEPPHAELPLAISMENAAPAIGSAALRICRQAPEQVCRAFLPFLSVGKGHGPRWQANRHSFDARSACEFVWRHVQTLNASCEGVVLTLPGYMQPPQCEALRRLGEVARLPVLGSLPTILSAALAGHLERFWQHSVLVIDVDDYALTLGWVTAQTDRAHLIESRSFPHLGLRFWHDRLINTLADLFVWQHRRDLRDSASAEQTVYDQLESLIDAGQQRRAIQLGVKGKDWFKHLLVHPEQSAQFCQPLVKKVVAEADHLLLSCTADEAPRGILLTHQAGRLPGLVEALQELFQSGPTPPRPEVPKSDFHEEDFGESLLFTDNEETGGVMVLSAEAPARSAHALAERFSDGLLPTGHQEASAPLLAPCAADAGPPRLHFRGHDYLLHETSFMIGSQYGCQLYFDKANYPDVAARHCEIVFDHRAFTLYGRSREVTLVNDHPVAGSVVLHAGDQIRLGLRGPVVRFLGKTLPRPARKVFV